MNNYSSNSGLENTNLFVKHNVEQVLLNYSSSNLQLDINKLLNYFMIFLTGSLWYKTDSVSGSLRGREPVCIEGTGFDFLCDDSR